MNKWKNFANPLEVSDILLIFQFLNNYNLKRSLANILRG